MTPRFVFRPEARAELLAARDWYAAQAAGLELEFARAVDAAPTSLSTERGSGVRLPDRSLR